jgi:hypothetical protein
MIDLTNWVKIIKDVATVLALLIGAWWAYRKFRRYEALWLATQVEASLQASIRVKVLPGGDPQGCILALRSTIKNEGKVNTSVDMSKSWFAIEQLAEVVPTEDGMETDAEGRLNFRHGSLLDVTSHQIRISMGAEGPAVVRAGVALTFSNACPVQRGIYRVSAEYPLGRQDRRYYGELVGLQSPVEAEDRIVWSASTIVDTRLATEQYDAAGA